MKNSWHCELCDHQTVELMKGSICNLTQRKPDFYKSCSKISLNKKFEDKLKQAATRVKFIEKDKWWKYCYFILFFSLGCGALWFAFNIMSFSISKYFKFYRMAGVSTAPIVLGGISFILYNKAFSLLIKFRQDLQAAQRDKDKIDQVLATYNINYNVAVKFGRNYHGTQEVEVELKQR